MQAFVTKQMKQTRRFPSYLASLVASVKAQLEQMTTLVAHKWTMNTTARNALVATNGRSYQASGLSFDRHESTCPIYGSFIGAHRSTRIRGGIPT